MNDLLKHPAILGGALVLGLVIFAMSRGKGSGSDARLSAAIESQKIASDANVQLSGISAQRDVAMAQALNQRTAIAADREVQGAQAINTARAITLSHSETMRGLDISQTLGTMQTQAARDVAMAGLARDTYAITKSAEVQHATLAVANTMQQRQLATTEYLAGLSSDLQRSLAAQSVSLAVNPDVLHHYEVLAQINQDGATARAVVNASAAANTYTQNSITNALLGKGGSGGGIVDSVLSGIGKYFMSGSGSGSSSTGSSGADAASGLLTASNDGGGGIDWGSLAGSAAMYLAFA